MNKFTKSFTLMIVLGSLLLSACGGNQSASVMDAADQENVTQVQQEAGQTTLLQPEENSIAMSAQSSVTNASLQTSASAFPSNLPQVAPLEIQRQGAPTYTGDRPCLRLSLVQEYIPDGTVFAPSTSFDKVWVLRNTGNCTWTSNYSLIWVGGTSFNGAKVQYFNDRDDFPAEGVLNGSTYAVHMWMQAPSGVGHFRSYWMLRDDHGTYFGWGSSGQNAFWVDIKVEK